MIHRFHRKALIVGLTAALSLGTGIAAFAYWSATGSGTGSAGTTAGESIVITQTNSISDLEPGTTAPDTLIGSLSVSNGMYAYVGTITPTVTGTSNPGCTAADFTVTPSVYDQEVQNTASGVTLGTIVFNDTATNQDACKGATVEISYSSDGGIPAALVSSTPSSVIVGSAASGLVPADGTSTNQYANLTQVSCPADGFCVAVGSYTDENYAARYMVDTLSSGSWTSMNLPMPFMTGSNAFQSTGLSCATTTSCVMVGNLEVFNSDSTASYLPIIYTWDGTTWSYSSPALPWSYDANHSSTGGIADLLSVSCTSPTSCVAVGNYTAHSPGGRDSTLPLIETLSGTSWTPSYPGLPSDSPNPASAYVYAPLTQVSCTSASFCEAVGSYTTTRPVQAIETVTFNGTSWTPSAIPAIPDDYGEYAGPLSCPSDNNCVMIGTYEASTGITTTMSETLSGGSWTEQDIATPDGAAMGMFPQAISCTSTTSCLSGGFYFTPSWAQDEVTATLDSTGWTVSSFTGPYKPTPQSVSCSSSAFCEITGINTTQNPDGNSLPLAQQFP